VTAEPTAAFNLPRDPYVVMAGLVPAMTIAAVGANKSE